MPISRFRVAAAQKFFQIYTQHSMDNNYICVLKGFGSGPSKSILPNLDLEGTTNEIKTGIPE